MPWKDEASFFSKKVEIFTSVQAFTYIKFVYKIFLTNSFVWQNNHEIICYVNIINTCRVAYVSVQYSKTCITHKHNLRIDLKFGNKFILTMSTDLCHKISMLGSQNGPLMKLNCLGTLFAVAL